MERVLRQVDQPLEVPLRDDIVADRQHVAVRVVHHPAVHHCALSVQRALVDVAVHKARSLDLAHAVRARRADVVGDDAADRTAAVHRRTGAAVDEVVGDEAVDERRAVAAGALLGFFN